MPGFALDDLMLGISACRNPKLANVFYRLQLIEAYGTGIHKIMNAYKGAAVQPQVTVTNNAFKIVLSNLNYSTNTADESISEAGTVYSLREANEKNLLNILQEQQIVTRQEVQALLGVSQSTALRLLKKLLANNKIVKLNGGRTTSYILSK